MGADPAAWPGGVFQLAGAVSGPVGVQDVDVIVEHIARSLACCRGTRGSPSLVTCIICLGGRSSECGVAVAAYVLLMEKLAMKVYRGCPFITVSHSTAADVVADGVPAGTCGSFYNGVTRRCSARPPRTEDAGPVGAVGRSHRKTKCVTQCGGRVE